MRNKRFWGILLSVIVLSMLTAGVALAADEKVGGIDPQKVLFQHPKYEQTLKQIQTIAEKNRAMRRSRSTRRPTITRKRRFSRTCAGKLQRKSRN